MIYPSMIGTHDVNNITVLRKIQKRREMVMSNDLLISCINKTCNISTGSMGNTYTKVVILEVVENWIKVEKNGKVELINSDYVQNIKMLD